MQQDTLAAAADGSADADRAADGNRPRPAARGGSPGKPAAGRTGSLSDRYPWLVFLLPFVVYMAVGSLEVGRPEIADPQAAEEFSLDELDTGNWLGIRYKHYPIVYTVKITLTIGSMLLVLPGYRQFPCRVSLLAIGVGVVGVVLWIWICSLQLERALLVPIGLESLLGLGERPAYNPFEQLADAPAWAYVFLAVRFLGLALIVPIIEEFFLRGFLMRFVVSERWWEWPFGQVTPLAVVVGTLFPMLMHPPAELLAAAVWFSLVTWLMVRTKNIWDCVAAHAVTNLLLGIYVVTYGEWQLW